MTARRDLTQPLLRDDAAAAAQWDSDSASKTYLVPFAPVENTTSAEKCVLLTTDLILYIVPFAPVAKTTSAGRVCVVANQT